MCESCDYEDYIEKCEDILNEDALMGWCHDIVSSIHEWIEENKHITENQMRAIDNYIEKLEEKREA